MTGPPTITGTAPPLAGPPRRRVLPTDVLVVLLLVVVALRVLTPGLFTALVLQAWSTVFVAVCLQALPFLVLGVLLSAAITAFVPADFFERALPRRAGMAVPVAGLSGAVLPGCECASVPVAGSLVRRGVAPAPALTFLLSRLPPPPRPRLTLGARAGGRNGNASECSVSSARQVAAP
ncbi:Predicted permease [Geodermatophilus amargosae]|uniref:Predicted permease n=1 Tax=Geodermatophilus amargosae TaxID=1296565 RepID=A0A1I6ZDK9_9ACTN|nr:permease [Geodermatophilus amargosae]SFT60758.1 Predicted permease [Geodermatophilus amargosae]